MARHRETRERHELKLLRIERSDGKRVVKDSKSKSVDNGPAAAQLQKVVDSEGNYNYYQELTIGSSKNIDWRKKLGSLLVEQVGKEREEARGQVMGKSDTSKWTRLLVIRDLC